MRQHFAEFLGVFCQFSPQRGVDKVRRKGQHRWIGIHLVSPTGFHQDGIFENMKQEHRLAGRDLEERR